jgi:glycosyltransferase involved in cell wall biosynthesis
MRITYISAGAGGMYCGSCIRDNALAASLMNEGHEVLLLPLYTPSLTDEENVSSSRVFYSGISVYLEQYVSLFRHTPWLLDRLWESPWLLRTVADRAVQTNPEDLGELLISVLEGQSGHQAKEVDKLIHWLKEQPTPDVIDISNSMLIALAQPLKEALGVPVCCTLQGEEVFIGHLSESLQERARKLIKEHARYVDRFLAVSDYGAGHMSRFLDIPGAKFDVVPLGITVDGCDRRTGSGGKGFAIGHFGRLSPEKGLHLLCEAYRQLREAGKLDGGSLEIAGYLSPSHEGYFDSIMKQMREWGLEQEVTYHGKLDRPRKLEFLRSLDMLVIPAVYDDPKGLPVLEAMACGVPTVVPRRGTYTEFIKRTGGGVLVEPDDVEALTSALADLVSDPDRLDELGNRGATGVREHYTAGAMATRALAVYNRLVSASPS